MPITLENVGIAVSDLDEAIAFFTDLGLTVIGRDTVSGEWADTAVGLDGNHAKIAMLQTPDGNGRLELFEYIHPDAIETHPTLPHEIGMHRVAFSVDDIDAALAASREFGLEGVVVKDPSSRYRPGQRSPSWLKLKHTRMQEAVIVGIRPGKGDREGTIGSLLLAVPDPIALRYVGRVGTGFTERMLRDLLSQLTPLRVAAAPLDGVPALDASDALWVRPELVGEVEFANWTPDGILRHARWRGLRPDKTPAEVVVDA